ncbi:MAG: carotenoid biosynthesis protein [Paenibacillaceae bacterium]|jgi:putative membrane protein|nr:carotenoid biosynthesis protein [Paenibacillaceae bacterium]
MMDRVVRWAGIVYGCWFFVGCVLLLTNTLPERWQWANSVYLLLAGALAWIAIASQTSIKNASITALITASVSYGAEWIGVHTGWWFGSYTYSGAFVPLIGGVPLAIPFAWLAIIAMASSWVRDAHRWSFASSVALLAVGFDLLLDPVAVARRFWQWYDVGAFAWYGVPWTNFVGWFVTAWVIAYAVHPRCTAIIARPHIVLRLLSGSLFVLFLLLGLQQQLYGPCIASVAVWVFVLYRSHAKQPNDAHDVSR